MLPNSFLKQEEELERRYSTHNDSYLQIFGFWLKYEQVYIRGFYFHVSKHWAKFYAKTTTAKHR